MKFRFKLFVPLTYKDVEIESEEVELNNKEITLIKCLVNQSPNKECGLMSILENNAPELYEKLWKAIEKPLYNAVVEDGRKNGYVDEENVDGGLDMDCVDFICKIPDFAK